MSVASFGKYQPFHPTNTRNLQGILFQFSCVAGMEIDLVLSLTYLLMIKCQWREEQFQSIGKRFHWVVWPVALGPALWLLALGDYDLNTDDLCWISGCANNLFCRMNAALYVRSGTYVLSGFHLIFSIYTMANIYRHMQNTSPTLARRGLLYASSVIVVQLPQMLRIPFTG